MGFHRFVESLFVDGQPVFFENVAGDFEREAERGVEDEGGFSVKLALSFGFEACNVVP